MKYLIVGLGNPGKKYVGTRHNIGFDAVDWLAGEWGASNFLSSRQAEAVITEVHLAGEKVGLVKPLTFMNNSGSAVRDLADYFSIAPENVLVIYDDVDLPLETAKFAVGRGSGGHRGVQSVINELGTKDFARIRIGITPPDSEGKADKAAVSKGESGINPFVLGQFREEERVAAEGRFGDIANATEKWVDGEAVGEIKNELH